MKMKTVAIKTRKTRSARAMYGLGNAVNEEDGTMTGVRLPTCRQVLRCLMWHIQKEIVEGKQHKY